ncbi:MAG: hypothetical protein J5972_00570, partial [Eubacterium sp.]|nr:hypothetical protein [Eubacterium sp.]
MKKRFKKVGKRVAAASLALAMTASVIPDMGIVARAAGTPQDREDNTIVYAVDCGDLNPATVPTDGPLGTHNSVTEQVYGADSVTGYKWGIDDSVSSTLVNGSCPSGGVSTDWTWPNELVGGDNASKTATNRYTKNQFENGIATRHLDYKFEIENGDYLVEIGFTDPWGCSQSPSVYANKGQADEAVIATNFDVSTNQGVVTKVVTVTDGELTINATGTGDSNKAINMTYITIKESGDASNVASDIGAISLPLSTTANLELPTTGSKAGSTISWSSDKPEVISTTGVVTRPASGQEDVDVNLTATVTSGSVSNQKTFTVTVLAMNELMGADYFDKTSVEVTDAYYDNA